MNPTTPLGERRRPGRAPPDGTRGHRRGPRPARDQDARVRNQPGRSTARSRLATDPAEAEQLREEVLAGEDQGADRARIARSRGLLTGDPAVADSLAALEQPAPDASGTAAMPARVPVGDGDGRRSGCADAIPSTIWTTMPSPDGAEPRSSSAARATWWPPRGTGGGREGLRALRRSPPGGPGREQPRRGPADLGELVEGAQPPPSCSVPPPLEDLHGEGSTLGSLALVGPRPATWSRTAPAPRCRPATGARASRPRAPGPRPRASSWTCTRGAAAARGAILAGPSGRYGPPIEQEWRGRWPSSRSRREGRERRPVLELGARRRRHGLYVAIGRGLRRCGGGTQGLRPGRAAG